MARDVSRKFDPHAFVHAGSIPSDYSVVKVVMVIWSFSIPGTRLFAHYI
jgi:hypothetical protein